MMNNNYYNVYGLNIQSSIAFPEMNNLAIKSAVPDVFIHFGNFDIYYSKKKYKTFSNYSLKIKYTNNDSILFWNNEIIFKVKNGNKIIINPKVSINKNFLRSLILGQAMGILLYQRGYLVLHASSVCMDGGVVAFIGASGSGKSTLAAALTNNGYPLIEDDILAIKFNGDTPIVFPSFPRIKLWEDVIGNLTLSYNSLTRIRPHIRKYSYIPEKSFYQKQLPLKSIYILEKSEKTEIISLKPNEILINLVKNSYTFRLFGKSEKTSNLFHCANIIKNVPVKNLRIQQSIEELDNLIKFVETDVFSGN